MIVSFNVSNYRSFAPNREVTFSLVASGRSSEPHDGHAVKIPNSDERVLRAAVIYGANGAGKSNLFKALQYVKSLALEDRDKGAELNVQQFCLNERPEPLTEFDLQFVAGGKLFRLGFTISKKQIEQEWLIHIVRNKEKVIYERLTASDGVVKVELNSGLKKEKKLGALATVGGLANQSFLATINNTLSASEFTSDIKKVIEWFEKTVNFVGPDDMFASLGQKLESDSDFTDFAGEFLRASSTGVDGLVVDKTEVSIEDLRKFLPSQVYSQVLDQFNKEGSRKAIIRSNNGKEFHLEKKKDSNSFYTITVKALHALSSNSQAIKLDLGDESDGTQRLLDLLPALHKLKTSDSVYVIDEIDRSMHPLLVWKFLQFFLRSCPSGHSQIIVTTHEANLLDLNLLRRDEIWFAEKDKGGATQLYPLTDFSPRKDLELKKHYLQGRFGAVPFLGNIDNLLPDHCLPV